MTSKVTQELLSSSSWPDLILLSLAKMSLQDLAERKHGGMVDPETVAGIRVGRRASALSSIEAAFADVLGDVDTTDDDGDGGV